MAINKDRNVIIAITFSKEDAEQLDTLVKAYKENGFQASRSKVLVQAFRTYLKLLVQAGNIKEHEEEEPQGEKKDA